MRSYVLHDVCTADYRISNRELQTHYFSDGLLTLINQRGTDGNDSFDIRRIPISFVIHGTEQLPEYEIVNELGNDIRI